MSKLIRTGLILGGLIFFGAGCAKQATKPVSSQPVPMSQMVPAPATAPSTTPAQSTSSPPPVSQANCPITPEILKTGCKLEGKITLNPYPCTFDIQGDKKTSFKYPVFQAHIKPFRSFVPGLNKDTGMLAEIIEGRRMVMNQTIESHEFLAKQNIKCNRIETRPVSGLGDEALLAPVTILGCEHNNVAPASDIEKAPWLWIRKGNIIAEVVVAAQDDTGGNDGCSSQEVLEIARKYVLPAM